MTDEHLRWYIVTVWAVLNPLLWSVMCKAVLMLGMIVGFTDDLVVVVTAIHRGFGSRRSRKVKAVLMKNR